MKILIADDDAISRHILETMLSDWGYEVVSACDGAGAWEILQEKDPPCLAIIDWIMPGVDGVEVVRRARALSTMQPPYIIMLTVKEGRHNIIEALESGANDYLCKPFDHQELLARLHVGERVLQLQNELARNLCVLRESESRLLVCNSDLEKKVMDRTVALEEVNERLAKELDWRMRAEEELHKLNRALLVHSLCNETLVRSVDELQLLRDICSEIVSAGGYPMVWVGYADRDDRKSIRPMAWSGQEEGFLQEARFRWSGDEDGDGPCGRAVRSGLPCVVGEIANDPCFATWRDEAIRRGYLSAISLPLVDNGQVFGVLNIYGGEADLFDEETVNLFTVLANDLAYGILSLRTRIARMEAEEALREAMGRAEAASRLKTEIIANMSHEVRTPLTHIIGFADILASGMPGILNERQADYVNNILSGGRRLLSLLVNILDISESGSSGAARPTGTFAAGEVVEEQLELFSDEVNARSIELCREIGGDTEMNGDRERLGKVLQQLIGNALKFTPDGGRVSVSVRRTSATPAGGGDMLEFVVADSGIGIDPGDMPRLFQPFVQLEPSLTKQFPGAGLGLAVVRKLVELLHGEVRVESEPGKGSRFIVAIPTNLPHGEVV